MLDGFEKWQPPTDALTDEGVRSGIIVLDANILLNLYSLDEDAVQQWMAALDRVLDRLWLPHQVMEEFWRNRHAAVVYPVEANQAQSAISRHIKEIEDTYRHWSMKRRLGGGDQRISPMELSSRLREAARVFSDELDTAIDSHNERFSVNPEDDAIVTALRNRLTGRVGIPYSPDEASARRKEADQRFSRRVPPGFLDDKTTEGADRGKSGDTKYGDALIWMQTLDYMSGRVGSESSPRHLVLVTDDRKEDWWQTLKVPGDQPIRMPHPGLVEEARRVAAVSYVQLDPASFLDAVARVFGGDFDSARESAAPAPEGRIESDRLDRREFRIARRGTVHARGILSDDGRGITVLEGSTARVRQAPTMPAHAKALTDRLISEGILAEQPDIATSDARRVFTRDYAFDSTSTAATVIQAANVSGPSTWVSTENGELLRDLTSDSSSIAGVHEAADDEPAD